MSDAPETITRDELAEALRDLQITPEGENTFYPAVAEAIFERARRSREPEYKPGAMYQCADGKNWLYQPERNYARDGSWADCPWLKPGDRAAYSLNSPKRPLRKLVPEGSEAARADHGAILDAITTWGRLARTDAIELAARICKLTGGDCSDD